MNEHRRNTDRRSRAILAGRPYTDGWGDRAIGHGVSGRDNHLSEPHGATSSNWPTERAGQGRTIDGWLDGIHVGDYLDLLRGLPDGSANLVITSPPYFQQRRYTDDPREIGREDEIGEYLEALHRVFDECVRVTRDDGSIVFNLGDKYVNGGLALVPHRFAIGALDRNKAARLINDVTWVKPNPTPRQCDRRMVGATEPFFHFVKGKYYKYRPERLSGTSVQK